MFCQVFCEFLHVALRVVIATTPRNSESVRVRVYGAVDGLEVHGWKKKRSTTTTVTVIVIAIDHDHDHDHDIGIGTDIDIIILIIGMSIITSATVSAHVGF